MSSFQQDEVPVNLYGDTRTQYTAVGDWQGDYQAYLDANNLELDATGLNPVPKKQAGMSTIEHGIAVAIIATLTLTIGDIISTNVIAYFNDVFSAMGHQP
jgi:Flp pilus assembly pilin Flp